MCQKSTALLILSICIQVSEMVAWRQACSRNCNRWPCYNRCWSSSRSSRKDDDRMKGANDGDYELRQTTLRTSPPSSSSCTEQSVAGARRRSREWDQRAPAAVAAVNSRRPDAQPTIPCCQSVGQVSRWTSGRRRGDWGGDSRALVGSEWWAGCCSSREYC